MSNVRPLRARAPGRVAFIGAVHEAGPALEAVVASVDAEVVLLVTVPRISEHSPSGAVDLAAVAEAEGLPVLHTVDVNAPEDVAAIRETRPDLIVVVGWTRLIGRPLLAVPPRGCVGFHASLLPHNRGRAPVNWAILRGETVTGNTMMMLDPGTDTGDIVDQRRIVIGPDDTCATVYARVAEAGAQMLTEHLPALLAGTAPRRPQHSKSASVLPKRTPEMGITDWSRPARALHDWIRALTCPYPGAFTSIRGVRVMLWGSRLPGGTDEAAPAGTVLHVGDEGLLVATGAGSLLVTDMSDPGALPQPASRWCRSAGLRRGAHFDAVHPATALWALGLGPRPRAEETAVTVTRAGGTS
ncbi:methionyl-tRNA formyltransferase [Pseudonocardia halophobica]|uniref:methionyl-tRNA formyltransferase n=1 Tax=Pseudonocardia halophobica TaxID=29401 RepID=UPI003D8A8A29